MNRLPQLARGKTGIRIEAGPIILNGFLEVPSRARGIVLFAHGSGSSRHSRRNQWVAEQLHHDQLATLLFDLLTEEEEQQDAATAHLRFDIGLLAGRLRLATAWMNADGRTADLPMGYFGASTGGAAALIAAAQEKDKIQAVVSRGGRPDLAGENLPRVEAATLLIVGGNDPEVLELNRAAFTKLRAKKRLEIIPGATHLFEEPGTLDSVAALASSWFLAHFSRDVFRNRL